MKASPGEHWEQVYRERDAQAVSWFAPRLALSLELLDAHGLDRDSRVLDVGGGASTLVDDLLARSVASVAVLDLSAAALDLARARLGGRAAEVQWLVGDVRELALPEAGFSHWHDRAVLHFLTSDAAVYEYARQAARAVAAGGCAVLGGFAPTGPERCSGLPVARRSPEQMAAHLAPEFELIESREEVHRTPAGQSQAFAWARLRRRS